MLGCDDIAVCPVEERESEPACVVCREAVPEGHGVEVDGNFLCRCCNSDAIEASREETTAVGVRL